MDKDKPMANWNQDENEENETNKNNNETEQDQDNSLTEDQCEHYQKYIYNYINENVLVIDKYSY